MYDTNHFDNNFNHFHMFLTSFNSSVEGSYHMETSLSICNRNRSTGFCMAEDFSVGYSQTDFNLNFNIDTNLTVDSYMNSRISTRISQPLKDLLIFSIMKH